MFTINKIAIKLCISILEVMVLSNRFHFLSWYNVVRQLPAVAYPDILLCVFMMLFILGMCVVLLFKASDSGQFVSVLSILLTNTHA
jgi:hypothetical protein